MRKLALLFWLLLCPVAHAGLVLGGNDYVDTNFAPGSLTDSTWGGRFVLDSTPGGEVNLMGNIDTSGGELLQITFQSSLTPECYCGDVVPAEFMGITSDTDVTAGVPFEITCTLNDTGNMTMYLNGVQTAVGAVGTSCNASKTFSDDLIIGARQNGGLGVDSFVTGKVYHTYIFDNDITAAQAAQIAFGPAYTPCMLPDIAGYWLFDQGPSGSAGDGDAVFKQCDGANTAGAVSSTTNTWTDSGSLSYPSK